MNSGPENQLFFSDPDFVNIAEVQNVMPAQIAISWALQRGTASVPVPKSANVDRMKANISVRFHQDCDARNDLTTALSSCETHLGRNADHRQYAYEIWYASIPS